MMSNSAKKAIAIVGIGAIMPDAADARTFWQNIKDGKYSISEVPNDRWALDKYYDPDPKVPAKRLGAYI
jgi:acyl transferase domain-containing protein